MDFQKVSDLSKYFEEKGIPMNCMIELTYSCNFSCKHCYVQEQKYSKTMEFDTVKQIVDQLKDIGVLNITLTGGEPTLHKDLIKIISYIRDKNMTTTLFTNGSFLSDDLLKVITGSGTEISLTIYGSCETQYKIVTGSSKNYNKVFENIEKLLANNVPLTLKTSVFTETLNDLHNMYNYAKSKNKNLAIETIIRPTLNKNTLDELKLTEEELSEIFRNYFPKSTKKRQRSNWCGAGKRTICISPDGIVFPCPNLRVPLGDISKKTIKEILQQNKLQEIISNPNFNYMSNCKNCEAYDTCNACPGLWYEYENAFDKPCKELCHINKLRHKITTSR